MSMSNVDFNPASAKIITDLSKDYLSGMSTQSGNRFYDNSSLDVARVCMRKFYYSKIRKWKPTGIRIPLSYGSCWHETMDFVWPNPTCSADQAFEVFMNAWNASDLKDTDDFDMFPRSRQRSKEMLQEYLNRYSNWLERIELMAVEKPFIVPVSVNHQNLFYVGKWDKLYREFKKVSVADHKTSSSFANTWLNGWSPNGQVDGYLYAGHMEYGDEFQNVIIDGALLQKTKIDFIKVPIERQIYMLEQWKWEVLDLIEQIWFYESALLDIRSSKQDQALRTFPKCTTQCTTYYGLCPFINLCKFVPNPELIEDCPDGFEHDGWKPFEVGETPEGEIVVKALAHGE